DRRSPPLGGRSPAVPCLPNCKGIAMSATQETAPAVPQGRGGTPERKLTFARANEFQADLRRRGDDLFHRTGRRQRDCPPTCVTAAAFLTCLAAVYVLLVFGAWSWWVALPLAALLGAVAAGVGFNVQHDGGHGAGSDRPWVNKLMALTLDLIGGSSYFWHYQ